MSDQTTARLKTENKDKLEAYKEEHGLSSIDAAIDHILDAVEERKYTTRDRFPGHGLYFEEVHNNLGLKESYPIPPEFARTLLNREHQQGSLSEDEWVSRLFSLVHRHQYLLNTSTMGQADVLHVYEVGAMSYAFVLAKLDEQPGNVRSKAPNGRQKVWGWMCDVTSFPSELDRVLDANDFLAPTQEVPGRITYRGYETRLSDTLQGHKELAERLKNLDTYSLFVEQFLLLSAHGVGLEGVQDEHLAYTDPELPNDDPEKRIHFAKSAGEDTIREEFMGDIHDDLLSEDSLLINPYSPFSTKDAYRDLLRLWDGRVQTREALVNQFESLFVEPPTWNA